MRGFLIGRSTPCEAEKPFPPVSLEATASNNRRLNSIRRFERELAGDNKAEPPQSKMRFFAVEYTHIGRDHG
jgi:hypothetical protein